MIDKCVFSRCNSLISKYSGMMKTTTGMNWVTIIVVRITGSPLKRYRVNT